MLKNISRTQLIGAWVAAILVAMAVSVILGANLTLGSAELWLVAAVVPSGVILILWHGAPPPTVAELLYTVNSGSNDSRP